MTVFRFLLIIPYSSWISARRIWAISLPKESFQKPAKGERLREQGHVIVQSNHPLEFHWLNHISSSPTSQRSDAALSMRKPANKRSLSINNANNS